MFRSNRFLLFAGSGRQRGAVLRAGRGRARATGLEGGTRCAELVCGRCRPPPLRAHVKIFGKDGAAQALFTRPLGPWGRFGGLYQVAEP